MRDGNGHYYMLDKALWQQATKSRTDGRRRIRFLCFDCLEARLGRRVTARDLVITPPELDRRMQHGVSCEPLPADQRQAEFCWWRAFFPDRELRARRCLGEIVEAEDEELYACRRDKRQMQLPLVDKLAAICEEARREREASKSA
jgi:hypothetical protein